jgi:hypothetical protein
LFNAGPFKLFSFGPSSNINTGIGKMSHQSSSSYSAFIRNLFKASSGQIVFDKIIKITNNKFSGHVYDLQSVDNYILSNGIVSSNCRCTTYYKLKGYEKDYAPDWKYATWKANFSEWKKKAPAIKPAT